MLHLSHPRSVRTHARCWVHTHCCFFSDDSARLLLSDAHCTFAAAADESVAVLSRAALALTLAARGGRGAMSRRGGGGDIEIGRPIAPQGAAPAGTSTLLVHASLLPRARLPSASRQPYRTCDPTPANRPFGALWAPPAPGRAIQRASPLFSFVSVVCFLACVAPAASIARRPVAPALATRAQLPF